MVRPAAPDLDELRARAHEVFASLVPPSHGERPPMDLEISKKVQVGLSEAGLAGITFPVDLGGAGLTEAHDRVVAGVAAEYAVSQIPLAVPLGLCAPTIVEWGTDEQRREHIPGILGGRDLWCQLFSEPQAGSDLAGVRTRAEKVEGGWRLDGQKVWSSFADLSQKGLCIARTDAGVPKHAGLSAFVVDMAHPGVECRPIQQITGEAEFNEVFLTGVEVGDDALIGQPGDGWRVALTMLGFERIQMGARSREFVTGYADRAIAAARERGLTGDPVLRQELARIVILEKVLGLAADRVEQQLEAGEAGGPEGSILKMGMAALAARTGSVLSGIHGPAAVAGPGGGVAAWELLDATKLSIAGGTSEIQRTIVGERVLGLPREPAVDRGIPFRDIAGGHR